jgi:hypothetical protein
MANGNGNGNGGGTSNPNPNAKTQSTNCDLAVQYNGNVAPFDNNPAVSNESPATKKSYSWNKGDGNGNGSR